MSIINHLDNASRYEIECPKCGRKIRVYEEYQVPGLRGEAFYIALTKIAIGKIIVEV